MDNDFNEEIYSSAFHVDKGSHLIEASAGTGKTFNIQNLFARFIMETDCRVANILVMTYTEAATKELRDRLHSVLADIQWRFSGKQLEGNKKETRQKQADDLISCSTATVSREKARGRVELALLEFDSASISTIHGFCQRVLARYAFETGMNFSQELKNNKNAELEARAEDWWRIHKGEFIDTTQEKLKDLKNYVKKLGGKTDYIIDSDDETLKTADAIVRKFENDRFERDNLNFDDLLRALRNALMNKNHDNVLASKLREEFKVALIDEFQDTDPVQYDIFKSIFMDEEHPSPLYFVGDPKQAIYAFRGGDIYTYLTAKGTVQNRHIITVNHRSVKRLVEAVNAMFQETKAGNTFGDPSIPFVPSSVPRDPTQIKGIPLEKPLQIIEFSHTEDKPSKEKYMPCIMETMIKQILLLLNQKDATGHRIFSPKDIAILMKANNGMTELQEKLLTKGIPCVIRKPGNVFSTPIALELKVFLEAIAEADSSESIGFDRLRTALFTVFGGKTTAELDNLNTSEDMSPYIENFKQMKSIWCSRGGFAALSNKMEQDGYLQRLAQKPKAERQLSDIGQIMELCCAAIKEIGSTPDALIKWLTERIDESGNKDDEHDSDEYERELETDGEAIKIMTIHSSKGLQFPIVFLPDCWRVNAKNDSDFYRKKGQNNEYQLLFTSDKGELKEKAREQSRLEKYRLLYVALTRAIQQCVLFTPSMIAIEKLKEPLGQLLENMNANSAINPPYEWMKDADIKESEEKYIPDDNGKWSGPTTLAHASFANLPSIRGSYSSLTPGQKMDDVDSRDCDEDDLSLDKSGNENIHPIFRLPSGARLGTCWHDILEKIDFKADTTAIRQIAESELADAGFRPDEFIYDIKRNNAPPEKRTTLDCTVKMMEDTLQCPLKAPNGEVFTLRDISWENRLSEQEFNFSSANAKKTIAELTNNLRHHWKGDWRKQEFIKVMEGWGDKAIPHGYLTGFMDLVFRHNGYFYVIDWKSNSMDGDIERFNEFGIREEMAKHGYFFQYMLYAAVLQTYLKSRLGAQYSWNDNFGGVCYYFLRGITAGGAAPVFEDRPSEELLDDFSKTLGMEAK